MNSVNGVLPYVRMVGYDNSTPPGADGYPCIFYRCAWQRC